SRRTSATWSSSPSAGSSWASTTTSASSTSTPSRSAGPRSPARPGSSISATGAASRRSAQGSESDDAVAALLPRVGQGGSGVGHQPVGILRRLELGDAAADGHPRKPFDGGPLHGAAVALG